MDAEHFIAVDNLQDMETNSQRRYAAANCVRALLTRRQELHDFGFAAPDIDQDRPQADPIDGVLN